MFEILSGGLFYEVTGPNYAHQDQGISPKGAMDRFSHMTGNFLLNNPTYSPALEIIVPPRIRFIQNALVVLTGAGYSSVYLKGTRSRLLDHGVVKRVYPGDTLEFGIKNYGFRTYLCYKNIPSDGIDPAEGMVRGNFSNIARWPDTWGNIRVMDGPEKNSLKEDDVFFSQCYRIHRDSNAMGMRLEPMTASLAAVEHDAMISGPVSDGTIQLTPKGPVVLLRHRQTIGGYPRIFNVITTDMDRLAQYAPGEMIRFKRVTRHEAINSLKQWTYDVNQLKQK